MRGFMILAALAVASFGAAAALWPPAQAQTGPSAGTALAQVRGEAARARERAAALDRQARAATLTSERATIAAAALGARVQQAEAALAGADAELAIVRGQRRTLDRALARERAPVARLLAGLQTQVRRPPLLTLLQPGSIEDAVHLRAVVSAVAPQITARTASLRQSLERSHGLEREAVRIASERRRAQSDLLARRNQLAAVSAAERLKARRAAGAANREAERAFAIGEQARDLTTLVRRLKASDRKDTAPRLRATATGGGGLASYRLPVTGRIVPQDDARSRSLSVLARAGALVVAPAAGRVAFAGPYRGYGEIVIIEHADGWTSLVTGIGKTQVAVGQTLVAGSPLGQAPDGRPRIGLELRKDGQRVNPLDHLR